MNRMLFFISFLPIIDIAEAFYRSNGAFVVNITPRRSCRQNAYNTCESRVRQRGSNALYFMTWGLMRTNDFQWATRQAKTEEATIADSDADTPQSKKSTVYYSPFGEKNEETEIYDPFDSFMVDDFDEGEEDQVKEFPDLSISEAKVALLNLIPSMTGSSADHDMVNHYIQIMEKGYIEDKLKIHTVGFFLTILRGNW
eukprot:CAMPEP_0194273484 /NCGR_PEP_ID=MMETSP0169-20130528/6814_1 /TAXON_ID=218684 /ORGANISM="Corethron pennatum, Strain L29A3" /LENGTH=197 /DNA_ID=CAMNT_0039016455 /DNA_START=199 /DNA_END=789 /DNA_ORIENTATION=-